VSGGLALVYRPAASAARSNAVPSCRVVFFTKGKKGGGLMP
jgi:hypothetical protein